MWEKTLEVFLKYNEAVIESLIAFILFVIAYYVYRIYKQEEGSIVVEADGLARLETFLKENAGKFSGPVVTPQSENAENTDDSSEKSESSTQEASSSEGSSEKNDEELIVLRTEVKQKQTKIEELEKQISEASKNTENANSAEDPKLKEYEKKISDLESRLSEYEIIEDDIANLSLYKEENQRLKQELDSLREGGTESAPEPIPSAKEEVEESASDKTEMKDQDQVDDLLRQVASQIDDANNEPEEEQAPLDEPKASDSDPLGDDLISEFAAALGGEGETGESEPSQDESPDESPKEEVPPVEAKEKESNKPEIEASSDNQKDQQDSPDDASSEAGDDILAEFASAVMGEEPKTSSEASNESVSEPAEESVSGIVEKEEASSAEAKEPAKSPVPDLQLVENKQDASTESDKPENPSENSDEQNVPTALEVNLDADTIVQEMSEFEEKQPQGIDNSEESEEDAGEKLIEEFENFVKSS